MISVIILAHGKVALTATCLRHLRDATHTEPLEVICVDNASAESFEPLRREFDGGRPEVRFLRNASNLSFSVANNRAVATANGDRLLFLNNDVMVGADSIRSLFDALAERDGAGAVGARLLFPGDAGVQHAGIVPMLWGFVSNYGVGAPCDDPRVSARRDAWAVTGAMLGIRRDVFERIGGFDEGYRWGYEDVDLCLRVRQAGWSIVYEPSAPSVHVESATLSSHRTDAQESANHLRFRSQWSASLEAAERRAVESLQSAGIGRVVIFGAGRAAKGLSDVLVRSGIDVVAFTSTRSSEAGTSFCGRPVVPLAALPSMSFDRLMAGSQFFFSVEDQIASYDPEGAPIFPVVQ